MTDRQEALEAAVADHPDFRPTSVPWNYLRAQGGLYVWVQPAYADNDHIVVQWSDSFHGGKHVTDPAHAAQPTTAHIVTDAEEAFRLADQTFDDLVKTRSAQNP